MEQPGDSNNNTLETTVGSTNGTLNFTVGSGTTNAGTYIWLFKPMIPVVLLVLLKPKNPTRFLGGTTDYNEAPTVTMGGAISEYMAK